jgi:protein-S-isoprenylcysteine O-methyltransferase Ste14
MIVPKRVKSALWLAVVPVCLFASAGTVVWPGAWLFLLLFVGGMLVTMGWLKRTDPALFEERTRSFRQPGQPGWDKRIGLAIAIVWFAWLIAMGIEARLSGGPQASVWRLAAGTLLFLAGYRLIVASFRANTFAATSVRLQPERGQTVIDTGPYAIVRHPIYSASLLLHLGTLLLLGAWRSVAGVVLLALLLGLRAVLEERTLRAGLPGYGEYASRVRWRLVPGVW